jgi:hypothetical protein
VVLTVWGEGSCVPNLSRRLLDSDEVRSSVMADIVITSCSKML